VLGSWVVVEAITEALRVLSWYENLPEDEQPPRKMWHSDKLLGEWFEDVDRKRKQKTGGKDSTSSYRDADDAPMMGNEFVDRDRLIPK